MDNYNAEFLKILELSVTDNATIPTNISLKDLFNKKLEDINITQNQALKLLDMELKTLNAILDNTAKRVDIVNIIKLAHFLGFSINEIMKVYIPNMRPKQIGEIQKSKEASFLFENFDLNSLINSGFITSKNIPDLKNRITSFFNLNTVYEYSETTFLPALSRTKRNSNDKVRDFWLKSAFAQFEGINNPYPYSRKKLLDLIPKIRPYTRNEEHGLTLVAKALYMIGITVIYQPSIAKLQVRGATVIVNNKPCIVISDLNKRYPNLWFTLLHELYHILYDLDDIKSLSYHLTGEQDLSYLLLDEEKADDFAQQFLLSDDKLFFISQRINSESYVNHYSKEWSVHPSIIYAFYCYKYKDWRNPISKKIPSTDSALKYLNTNTFNRDSIKEIVTELKETIFNI